MINISCLLREKGYKVTPQRLAIYEALACTKIHPSAETLFQQLVPRYPMMSLATVYKTIEIFKNVGIATVINVGENSFRYELTAEHHPHMVCKQCHGVEDAIWPDDTDYKQKLLQQFQFNLHTQQFFFYGVCRTCKSAE